MITLFDTGETPQGKKAYFIEHFCEARDGWECAGHEAGSVISETD